MFLIWSTSEDYGSGDNSINTRGEMSTNERDGERERKTGSTVVSGKRDERDNAGRKRISGCYEDVMEDSLLDNCASMESTFQDHLD